MDSWFLFVVICNPNFFLHSSVAFDSLLLEWNQNTVQNMVELPISEVSEVIKQTQRTSRRISIWKNNLAKLDAETLSSLPLSLARILTLK